MRGIRREGGGAVAHGFQRASERAANASECSNAGSRFLTSFSSSPTSFDSHETAVLLFAKDPNVSFSNNRAERDLRMSKVKRKVSCCFRKTQYAEAYCRIFSYLQTMANRGYSPLVAIQLALSGQLYALLGE